MANEMRASALALFFVLGMAFMAAIFLLANPQWAEHERVREGPRTEKAKLIFVEESAPANPEPTSQAEIVEQKPHVPVEKSNRTNEPIVRVSAPVEPPAVAADPVVAVQNTQNYPASSGSRAVVPPLSMANFGGPGTLRGRAVFLGKAPPEKELPLDQSCGDLWGRQKPTTRFYVVGPDGGLGNVVVKVVSPIPKRHWPVPADPLVIASFRCLYEPYISAMQAGGRVVFKNRDPTMHNVHVINPQGREANFALLPKSKPAEFHVPDSTVLTIKDDVHPWQFAFVTVVEHPYFAVTDAEGKFEIKGLPTGKYVMEAVHRKAGTNTMTNIEVSKDGGYVEFEFK